jgi:polysaccharide pyruvyl transferase WcaK-like protein
VTVGGTGPFRSDNPVREQLQGFGHHRSLGKRPSQLAVIGNVGNGNTGDESLLAVTLAAVDRDAQVTVISRNPELVTRLHDVRAQPMTARAAVTTLLQCDGLIVVGGGMFGPGLPPLVRILPTVAALVKRSGRAVSYVGIGVYPGTSRGALRRLRQAAEHSEVTVRDMASIRTLNAKRPVSCIRDLAWYLTTADPALARDVLRSAGADGDRPLLLVSPKAGATASKTEEVINAMAAAVRYWTDLGGAVAAIALSDRVDRGRDFTDGSVAAAISARADVTLPTVGPNLAPSMAKSIVGCSAAVLGMRFHSLVFALSLKIPCMGIVGEPKTEALLDEHGLPAYKDTHTLHSWLDKTISPVSR